jgi:hypothetical protein
MKMNIILSIIAFDLGDLFKLERIYLLKMRQFERDYISFFYNLDTDWISFCINIYDIIKKTHKSNIQNTSFTEINVEYLLGIINNIYKNKEDTRIDKIINFFKRDKPNVLSKYVNMAVRTLFCELILMVFQYQFEPTKFPKTISFDDSGDSTKLQSIFNAYVKKQNEFMFSDYDKKIQNAFNGVNTSTVTTGGKKNSKKKYKNKKNNFSKSKKYF